eukprot:CAMPEP_0183790558 /NCGR_PEP_ID=MMETSP0803_2-20130417/1169_1 /TAXON_ID=195967 /ORGANISM="Crustomastix stigmata, Strain CCMP3273" /LENGTH=437 /DNA_ID=CAMNT_0026034795 /DNA_START=259 /DNA_END=1572 /DNA_ORIENTATION=-
MPPREQRNNRRQTGEYTDNELRVVEQRRSHYNGSAWAKNAAGSGTINFRGKTIPENSFSMDIGDNLLTFVEFERKLIDYLATLDLEWLIDQTGWTLTTDSEEYIRANKTFRFMLLNMTRGTANSIIEKSPVDSGIEVFKKLKDVSNEREINFVQVRSKALRETVYNFFTSQKSPTEIINEAMQEFDAINKILPSPKPQSDLYTILRDIFKQYEALLPVYTEKILGVTREDVTKLTDGIVSGFTQVLDPVHGYLDTTETKVIQFFNNFPEMRTKQEAAIAAKTQPATPVADSGEQTGYFTDGKGGKGGWRGRGKGGGRSRGGKGGRGGGRGGDKGRGGGRGGHKGGDRGDGKGGAPAGGAPAAGPGKGCWYCLKNNFTYQNHTADNCGRLKSLPDGKTDSTKKRKAPDGSGSKEEGEFQGYCHKCGMQGHKVANCPNR